MLGGVWSIQHEREICKMSLNSGNIQIQSSQGPYWCVSPQRGRTPRLLELFTSRNCHFVLAPPDHVCSPGNNCDEKRGEMASHVFDWLSKKRGREDQPFLYFVWPVSELELVPPKAAPSNISTHRNLSFLTLSFFFSLPLFLDIDAVISHCVSFLYNYTTASLFQRAFVNVTFSRNNIQKIQKIDRPVLSNSTINCNSR